MINHNCSNHEIALKLINDYLLRTGVTGSEGNPKHRYLWTDAFAVQACFALSYEPEGKKYRSYALNLIDLVHHALGQYRHDDPRPGWISGMSPDEGKNHPTAGGLRIGKKLTEKKNGEPFNQSMEWERDGQYFHYLTRWFNSLLQAYKETGEKKYARWAAELIKTSERFISRSQGLPGISWKMNTDLSRPVVESMGAHDPLEGLVCVINAIEAAPESVIYLDSLKQDFQDLCQDMSWFTTDALGIGSLLMNTAIASELSLNRKPLPPNIRPAYLFAESLAGIDAYSILEFNRLKPADIRLPFRECGLSLGFRVLYGIRDRHQSLDVDFNELGKFLYLVEDIENFWCNPDNQKSQTWLAHRDINEVTLGSSILARFYPEAFCFPGNFGSTR